MLSCMLIGCHDLRREIKRRNPLELSIIHSGTYAGENPDTRSLPREEARLLIVIIGIFTCTPKDFTVHSDGITLICHCRFLGARAVSIACLLFLARFAMIR